MIGIGIGLGKKRFTPSGAASGLDPDAQAFLTAASITDPTQVSALNQLVLDLKLSNLWDRLYAVYPILGGTATTHKYNLKDPRDLDAAFRMTFTSGWIHSSTGMTPNGSAYADSKLIPTVTQTQFNTSYGYYSRTDITAAQIELGATTVGDEPNQRVAMHMKWTDSNAYYDQYNQNTSNGRLQFSMSGIPTLGLCTMTRVNANDHRGFVKGIQRGFSSATATTNMPSRSIHFGAYNSNSPYFSTKQCAFAFIGQGLNQFEAVDLDTCVQTYQTTLGRAV